MKATDLTNYTMTLANLCLIKGETTDQTSEWFGESFYINPCRNGDG